MESPTNSLMVYTKKEFFCMEKPDKPYIPFEKQVEKLRDEYKLEIIDEELSKNFIITHSYYDLVNGYKNVFMENDIYLEEVSILDLVKTSLLDRQLRSVIINHTSLIEVTFKNVLAHVIAEHFGVFESNYLNINNYKKSKEKERRKKFSELIDRLNYICKNSTDEPTCHYRKTKNHIPPWVLFKNATFSDTTQLFQGLPEKFRKQVISYFDSFHLPDHQNYEAFLSALNMCRKYRNLAAHNLNFLQYNKKKLSKPICRTLEGVLLEKEQINSNRNSILFCLCSIYLLLNRTYLKDSFITPLLEVLNKIDSRYLLQAGITNHNIKLMQSLSDNWRLS